MAVAAATLAANIAGVWSSAVTHTTVRRRSPTAATVTILIASIAAPHTTINLPFPATTILQHYLPATTDRALHAISIAAPRTTTTNLHLREPSPQRILYASRSTISSTHQLRSSHDNHLQIHGHREFFFLAHNHGSSFHTTICADLQPRRICTFTSRRPPQQPSSPFAQLQRASATPPHFSLLLPCTRVPRSSSSYQHHA
ncbi:hypothetical protein DEO72_LG11g1552 [Vigna unguiculata]|uniref:Uncharacterized protein n=1 Tax=Vigna unguiculata TaxID=3917 RepID=A0A4D6NPT9_VIGUN|nr:hypothetical protein DEO72_LG11g1552 [Vigna unguiculata]